MGYQFDTLQFVHHTGGFIDPEKSNDCQAHIPLPNGFLVSVVKNSLSYGGEKGLYEIAVYNGPMLMHVDEWGDEVKGWLTPENVEKELDYLASL